MKKRTSILLLFFSLSIPSAFSQSPVITSFTPEMGNVGTVVTISGSNFNSTPGDNVVYFGATQAAVLTASSSQLQVVVPGGATYQPITVTTNGFTANSRIPFVVTFSNSIGAFGNRNDFWAGAQVAWSAVGDIDGDGKTDIISVDLAWNNLNVWRNTSTTGILSWDSFSYMTSFSTVATPYAVEVKDMNGDGKLDVVVASRDGSSVAVHQNFSGPGYISFAPPVEFQTASGPLFISIRDLDGDGKQDMAAACANGWGVGVVSVLRNTSSGSSLSFDPHVDLEVGSGGIWCVKMDDMDGDGKSDILVTSGGSAWLSIFRNIAAPGSLSASSFAPRVDYTTGIYPSILSVADFDGDQKQDVVVGNAGDNTMSLFRNVSTPGNLDPSSFVSETIFNTSPWNPTAGDVDGDGKHEILIRNGDGNLTVFKNNSTIGAFSFSPSVLPVGGAPLGIVVADLDGDEKADLMISNETYNVISVFQNVFVDPPTALPATFVSNTGFEVKWIGTNNAYEYRVDVSPTEDFSYMVDGYADRQVWGNPGQTLRLTAAGLQAATNYYYRVRAITNGTASPNSSTISVHTDSNPPPVASNIWTKQFGDWGYEEVQAMTSDSKGNLFIAGHFTGSLTFGTTTLNSQGDYDIFFAKLDPQGNPQWAHSIGGPYYDNEVSIAVDEQGLYLTAKYAGDIDVDPGPGSKIFTNDGLPDVNDCFFARYNLNNGSLAWARKIQDAATWSSTSIGVDKNSVYLTGHFVGSVDFNPGPGTAMLNSNGGEDIFLARYTLQGNYMWAESMGGAGNDTSWGLMADATGIYIHGSYGGDADFDPKSGTTTLQGSGGFFGRYDSGNGNLKYVKNVGNGTIFSVSRFANELFISGDFSGVIDADPGSGTSLIGADGYYACALIGHYNLLDGKFRWAKGLITTGFIGARQIMADPSGIYVSGYFGGSVDFDGGTGEENRSSGQVDVFAANYSRTDGSLQWVKGIGSPGRATSIAATMTKSGYYIAGLFALTVNFDPYTGSNFLSSVGGTDDLFIAKYPRSFCAEVGKPTLAAQTNTGARVASDEETDISVDQTTLYPNPVREQLSIDWKGFADGPIEVTITDTFGKVLLTTTLSPGNQNLDVSQLASGLHLFHARQGATATSQRFIKK